MMSQRSIKYTIIETAKNGASDTRSKEFSKNEVVFGRGSNCDVRLDSKKVSLTHAKFEIKNDRLVVQDLDSLSGVQVNSLLVKFQDLSEGDQIKLADIKLTLQISESFFELIEEREEKEQEDNEKIVARELNRLDITRQLPRPFFLGVVLSILAFAFYFLVPFLTDHKDSWSSGPISNKHKMFAGDCRSCHSAPFTQVQDKDCLSCHKMTDHSDFIAKHRDVKGGAQRIEARCAECHIEHNGKTGIIENDSRLCLECHSDIKNISPDSKTANVPSFKNHPEFAVDVFDEMGEKSQKVRLDDKANLKDNTSIKLNHAIHLKPLRSKDKEVKLQCRDCHNASSDLKSIQKISFEKHCRSCHGLEFDDRLPGREVPHGDTDLVYKYLYGEYAKLYLSPPDDSYTQKIFSARAKPGQAVGNVVENLPKGGFNKSAVENESRNAERILFTKTACHLCHNTEANNMDESEANKNAVSLFSLVKPKIPERWMTSASFDHGAHEAVYCKDCHSGVYESTKTNDVLMPKVAKCQDCHTDRKNHDLSLGSGQINSDCVMCHSYHDSKLVEDKSKKTIEEIAKIK